MNLDDQSNLSPKSNLIGLTMRVIIFITLVLVAFMFATANAEQHKIQLEKFHPGYEMTKAPVVVIPEGTLEQTSVQAVDCNKTAKLRIIVLVISVVLGTEGIDRFYTGHIGEGVGKLLITILSCGLCGWIWWIIDM